MNYTFTIPHSVRKTAALLAIMSLLVSSLPFGVLTAFADSVNVVGIAITSSAQSIDTNTISSGINVQTQNASGTPEQVSEASVFTLTSTSPTGEFSATSGFAATTTSVTISSGTANRNFWYRDSTPGTHTLTVDASGKGWGTATQDITITAPAVIEQNAVCDSGCEWTTLADAVAGEVAGETITLKNQTHTITSTVTVNKQLTIVGEAGSKITTSGGNMVLAITADGVVLDGLTFEKTDAVNQNLIQINANNVTVQNSSFSGTYAFGDGQVSRGLEIAVAKTGFVLSGNTFTNLRQPAYINNSQGTVTNNHVATTRGWVIVSDSNVSFSGNTWGTNAVDIAIITPVVTGNNYTCEVVAQIVVDNNNALVDNQVQSPACPIDPVAPPTKPALNGEVIYDAISPVLPSSYPSVGFQATQTYEFGDEITFAPGTGRDLKTAAITLTSWACQSGEWNLGNCKSSLGSTFSHPITLNIYEVATGGGVGVLIGSVTQTFNIPFRPSSDSSCADTKQWKDTSGACFNGYNHVVTFDLTGITVPDSIIFGVAYNTQTYGVSPTGANGPYNSLNVGLNPDTTLAPYIGTDVDADVMYRNQNNAGYQEHTGWSSYRVAVAFTAVEPAPVVTPPTSGGGSTSGGSRNSNVGPTPQVLGASTDAEVYELLEAIKQRLLVLLAESLEEGQPMPVIPGVTGPATQPAATVSTPVTPPATLEEEEEGETVETVTEEEEATDEEGDGIAWTSYLWIFVALWLVATAAALWWKNRTPETVAMRVVQGGFAAAAILLLAAYFVFGLAGAFWPGLIVAIGAITTYFWTVE